ncbi:MAG: O-antigen ligase family protein, partial [Hyphomicrobiaceae bacterium]
MHTDAKRHLLLGSGARIELGSFASVLIGLALILSCIVYREPAPVDVLLMMAVFAVPMLGAGVVRAGTLFHLCLWLIVAACGLLGVSFSVTFDTAIQHQLVTLYLALSSFTLSCYIAQSPHDRAMLVFWCYTVGAVLAAIATIIGYFHLVPGAYELFTRYGRGQGTFKDPNVLGGAMAPALLFCAWMLLRGKGAEVKFAVLAAVPIAMALLLSFSRGAWGSTIFSAVLMAGVAWMRTRRRRDNVRMTIVLALGGGILAAGLVTALQFEAVQTLITERANLEQDYDQGPEGRFGGQRKAIGLILNNPLGIGTHTFRTIHHPEEAHNVYLSTFLNAGWLGGLAYVAAVLLTLGVAFRASLRMSSLQGPLLVATAAFAGLAFEGLIVDTDHWRTFFIVQAIIWGLIDAPTVPGAQMPVVA